MSALAWPEVDVLLEAGEDGPARRAQRGTRAAAEVVRDFRRLEGETTQQLLARLKALKRELMQLLAERLTAPDQTSLDSLIRQVDRLIADATAEILAATARPYRAAATLGQAAGDLPMRALQIQVGGGLPGAGDPVVAAASDNTLDLLTPPMRQFASEIKTGLRRIALAGGQRMEEIQRLQAQLAGQGFDQAQYRAERIVRTELGRVFGEATYARMVELARTFAFLKKAWTATKDSRTRLGHQQAAQTYARGKGIPIADRFSIPVHQEGKSGTKLIGVAQLRFPIDPLATPAGRVAASATIMCRCHAVVDVDPKAFAEFAKAQVQFAMGRLPLGAPGPPPAPVPVPTPRPRRRRTPRPPKPTVVAAPKPPAPPPMGPAGTPVSQALAVAAGAVFRKVTAALQLLDQVHGDGPLPRIPVGPLNRRIAKPGTLAYYLYNGYSGTAAGLGFGRTALKSSPFITVFHEVGHFLDHQGIGQRAYATLDVRAMGRHSPAAADAMRALQDAFAQSAPIQTLSRWRLALQGQPGYVLGQGGIPPGITARTVNYLLSREETFARAYAQYIATRSGHAGALLELRGMQAASKLAVDGVPAGAPRSQRAFWEAPPAGAWQYPWAWQDADFAPIAAAFDRLFEELGWRSARP